MNQIEFETKVVELANRGRKPRGKRRAEIEELIQLIKDNTVLESDLKVESYPITFTYGATDANSSTYTLKKEFILPPIFQKESGTSQR